MLACGDLLGFFKMANNMEIIAAKAIHHSVMEKVISLH
jgi:hypothetical protein